MANDATEKPSEELVTDEVMDEGEAFVTYDIASYPSDLTLSVISEMWKNKDITIPDFQRNFVWNIKQASLLIESFLLGLPVPQIFFYIDEENKNLVIDGQQRIMTIIYFFEGYFGSESLQGKRKVFRLSGLNDKSPFYNKKYVDLDESSQRKLKSSILRAINIRQLSPKEENTSIYHIFERLNTGGTPLRPQEIRNCVFRGSLSSKLKDLNKDKYWRQILGKKAFEKHQRDVELILRIFSLSGNWTKYEKPMKEFLNRAMETEKPGTSKRVEKFIKHFPDVTKYIVEQLGQMPFHVRGPLNTSVLDSVFCIILDNFNRKPSDLKDRFKKLLADKDYKTATYYGTSDVTVLQSRFNKAKHYLIGG